MNSFQFRIVKSLEKRKDERPILVCHAKSALSNNVRRGKLNKQLFQAENSTDEKKRKIFILVVKETYFFKKKGHVRLCKQSVFN